MNESTNEVKKYKFKTKKNSVYRIISLVVIFIIAVSFKVNSMGIYAQDIKETAIGTKVDVSNSTFYIDDIKYNGNEFYISIYDEKYIALSDKLEFSYIYYGGKKGKLEPVYFKRGYYIFKIKVPERFIALKLVLNEAISETVVQLSQNHQITNKMGSYLDSYIKYLGKKIEMVNEKINQEKKKILNYQKRIYGIKETIKEKEEMKKFASKKVIEEINNSIDNSKSEINTEESNIETSNKNIKEHQEIIEGIKGEIEYLKTGKTNYKAPVEEENKTIPNNNNETKVTVPLSNKEKINPTTNDNKGVINSSQGTQSTDKNSTNETNKVETKPQVKTTIPIKTQPTINNKVVSKPSNNKPNVITTKPRITPQTKPSNKENTQPKTYIFTP